MNPILFDFGIIQLRYYGLMYAIGLLIAIEILKRDIKRTRIKMTEDNLLNTTIWTFFGGIIGARFYYVIFNLNYYFNKNVPWYEFIAIWHGGLAIHGGIIGGVFILWLYCRKQKYPFIKLTDLAAPTLILAQAIGRIGNFMNGDAHGYPTDLPWGVVFKYGPAAYEYPNQATHPVMIYEMLLNLIAFFILFPLRKKGFKPGFIAWLYVIFYSIIRFCVSFFRADDLYFLGLRAPHVISMIGLFLGLSMIWYYKLYRIEAAPKSK